jgi:hypothetical protein
MSSGYLDRQAAESMGWISTANDTLPSNAEDFINSQNNLKGNVSDKTIEEKEKAELGGKRRGHIMK